MRWSGVGASPAARLRLKALESPATAGGKVPGSPFCLGAGGRSLERHVRNSGESRVGRQCALRLSCSVKAGRQVRVRFASSVDDQTRSRKYRGSWGTSERHWRGGERGLRRDAPRARGVMSRALRPTAEQRRGSRARCGSVGVRRGSVGDWRSWIGSGDGAVESRAGEAGEEAAMWAATEAGHPWTHGHGA